MGCIGVCGSRAQGCWCDELCTFYGGTPGSRSWHPPLPWLFQPGLGITMCMYVDCCGDYIDQCGPGSPIACPPVNETQFVELCPDNCNMILVDKDVAEATGTDGCDCIVASCADDVIYGMGGDDIIYTLEGIDRVYAGDGADTIYGKCWPA
eukprot:scaffold1808_cov360-Prasinococcus_capsulatus_cf.AAC.12